MQVCIECAQRQNRESVISSVPEIGSRFILSSVLVGWKQLWPSSPWLVNLLLSVIQGCESIELTLIYHWEYHSSFLDKYNGCSNPWIYFIVLWAYCSFCYFGSFLKQSNSTLLLFHQIYNSPIFQYLHQLVTLNNKHCIIPSHMHHLICLCISVHTYASWNSHAVMKGAT